MRIVIDLQGAQGESRHRGIGRYTLSLAQAMIRNRGNHEVIIALNGMFADTIEPIRAAFDGLLPQENIRIWNATSPVSPLDPENDWRRHCAELIREAFLTSLQPDVVHVTSLFEGYGDNAVHSIGLNSEYLPTAVTLYDLIPLMQSETYLKPNPNYELFYREKIDYLKKADLYLAISESSRQEVIQHLSTREELSVNIGTATESYFQPISLSAQDEQSLRQKFELLRPFVMYSGATDERKNHLRLIKAFSLLPVEIRKNHQLAIVGYLPNEHREKFQNYSKLCGLKQNDVVITGRVSDEEMLQFYNLCTLFVFPSWHEGFGLPALEAMSCGAAVIGSNTSSLPEVIGRNDALFDPFDEKSIAQKMTEVLINDQFRSDLARHGLEQAKQFSWDKSAQKALKAFEEWHARRVTNDTNRFSNQRLKEWLIGEIAKLSNAPDDENDWLKTAQSIARNHPVYTEKQLFVDISELVHRDSKSGIQRVVRSILAELMCNPPVGFQVEPVYAIQDEYGYRYARKFAQSFSTQSDYNSNEDMPIDIACGDIFIGLDLQHHVVMQQETFFAHMKNVGVKVHFVIYDLLPVLLPHVFPEGVADIHGQWLSVLSKADGVLCISRAVADEMMEWLSVFGPERLRPLNIAWFHLGADVAGSIPSKGLPNNAEKVLSILGSRPTFLMVGTIEPRKGQWQTLLAFEQLWSQGIDVNLVIIGKNGWNVELLVEILRSHSELDKRLFWLEGVSDEYLEKVYGISTCLIGASEGEGFGLPLIEAAQYKIPMILRDIPVFREVGGEYAYYFKNDKNPTILAETIMQWMKMYKSNTHPKSDGMPWLTWKQSTQRLVDIVLNNQCYKQWMPDKIHRFWGGDYRLGTQVGKRTGKNIESTGNAGYLVFGPYISLSSGNYNVILHGDVTYASNTTVDVVTNQGSVVLGKKNFADQEDVDGDVVMSLQIVLHETCSDLEIRVLVDAQTDIEISLIEIKPELSL